MKRALSGLAALLALTWSNAGFALDDVERQTVVEATVQKDAKAKELADAKESYAAAPATQLPKLRTLAYDIEAERKALDGLTPADPMTKASTTAAAGALTPLAIPDSVAGPEDLEKLEDLAALELTAASAALKTGKADELGNHPKTLQVLAATLANLASELSARKKAVKNAQAASDAASQAATDAETKFLKATAPAQYLSKRLSSARSLRCLTAYCFGGEDGTKNAFEPVLDLPVGLVWAAGGGALPSYINSHTVNIEFNAGLRFWFAYDIMSMMVYFSRPLIVGNDPIRVPGSSFEHPPSEVHRAFPSIGLGLAGDVVLLGISFDELRNGATESTRDRAYPANQVLSRSVTFSLGFSLFNTARNAAGDAMASGNNSGAGR